MSFTSSPNVLPPWYPSAASIGLCIAGANLYVGSWRLWYEKEKTRLMTLSVFVFFLLLIDTAAVNVYCFIPEHHTEVLRTLLSFKVVLWLFYQVCFLYPFKGYAYFYLLQVGKFVGILLQHLWQSNIGASILDNGIGDTCYHLDDCSQLP
jgi:hypothetical protein